MSPSRVTFPLDVELTWKAGAGRHPALLPLMISQQLSGCEKFSATWRLGLLPCIDRSLPQAQTARCA